MDVILVIFDYTPILDKIMLYYIFNVELNGLSPLIFISVRQPVKRL